MRHKTDQQLIAMVLRDQFGKVAGIVENVDLRDLARAEPGELPLTDIGYERLMAGIELGRRVAEPRANYNIPLTSTAEAVRFCETHFRRLMSEGLQEEFHVVTLNTKHRMIRSHLVTVGTLDSSLVHPREVFRVAVRDSAAAVIAAHNHPSGDPTPSREDVAVTDRLTEAGRLLGIPLLDHVVLGATHGVSMREYDP